MFGCGQSPTANRTASAPAPGTDSSHHNTAPELSPGVDVQPYDIPEHLLELLVFRELEWATQMRFEIMPVPDALHGGDRHPDLDSHRASAPTPSFPRRLSGLGNDLFDLVQRIGALTPSSRLILQTRQTVLLKPLCPLVDAYDVYPQRLGLPPASGSHRAASSRGHVAEKSVPGGGGHAGKWCWRAPDVISLERPARSNQQRKSAVPREQSPPTNR